MANSGKEEPIDLDGMTVAELRDLAARAEATAAEKVEAEKQVVLAETRTKLAALGLSLDAMLKPEKGHDRKARPGDAAGKLPVKYKGPNGEEWSGRGRSPTWLTEAEKQGRRRDEFKVKE